MGPQLFRSAFAPRYRVSFGIAMGLVFCCMCVSLITWWVAKDIESQTREIKRAKLSAAKKGQMVTDDISIDI